MLHTTEQHFFSKNESKRAPRVTKHLLAPILSGATKTVAMAATIENNFPSLPYGPTIPFGIGSVFGSLNCVIQYHYITKTIQSPGIRLVKMSEIEIENLSSTDEGKAFLILISSLSSGFIDAFKAYLKTSELDHQIRFAFTLQTFFTQQATHLQAMGQKWLGETGININNTLAGKIAKIFMLDFDFITNYFFDLRSLVTKLYPAFEGLLQFATVLNLGKILGLTNPYLLTLLALYTAYSQYLLHKGFGQEIMKHSLMLEKREHQYTAAVFDSLVDFSMHSIDHTISLFGDLLSILLPPDYIVKSSNLLAGTINGYTLLSKFPYISTISGYILGIIGASLDTIAQSSRMAAAWNQKITIIGKKPNDEIHSIGVRSIIEEKFGDDCLPESIDDFESTPSCTSRLAKRCENYFNYLGSQLNSYAYSIYGLFGYDGNPDTSHIQEKHNHHQNSLGV